MSDSKEIMTTEMGMGTLDVRDASTKGLALMRERVENQKQMLRIAIGLTAPNQWTVFAGTDKQGVYRETIYPTGGAADTILRRAFGLTWGEKEITVEDTPDGKLATCSAWLMRGDDRVEHFTGYRFMGGYIKNEADLRKGAMENMKSVAVRDLLGLRFRTPTEIQEMGLDVGKLERRAEFQSHDKQTDEFVAPFGRSKGKPLSDLPDDDLKWLAEAVKKSVDDPSKSKWRSKNEALYNACREEWKRRHSEPEKQSPDAVAKKESEQAENKPQPQSDTGEWDDVGPGAWDEREPGQEG